ncbi:glycohydrolase toxin TNT-related protein [Saccharomonospora sp. NPDC046836]|uniref:glycohydrolase toxin TNT-related protein n=1 Tax=Saccharomonospora sp. NPDC046836 TaxID=3156921 RepID=UPI0033E9EFC0
MGIELPAELVDIAARTGVSWPAADEDAMREQADAWRQAARELSTLAGDADSIADKALGALSGEAADGARRRWQGFVDPDGGSFTEAARGAGQAADRLDHAAEQVGAAKVEIVRQLVDAARNHDAAVTAAESGQPAALAGLDTVLRGTATNLGALTSGLVGAVGPGADGAVPLVTHIVNAHPGAHTADGQAGLLSAATGVPAVLVETALHAPEALPGEPVLEGLPAADLSEALPGEPAVPDEMPGEMPGDPVPPESPDSGAVPSEPDADGTGPIAIADAPTPPRGGFLPQGGVADLPTPPTGVPMPYRDVHAAPGQTHLAGFTGAPAPGPVVLPHGQPFAGHQPFPGQPYAAQPFAGQHFSGAPAHYGAPPPAAPQPIPGAGPQPRVAPFAPAPPVRWAPAPEQSPYGGQQPPQHRPPEPIRPQPPAAPVPVGAPRQERESIVALFLVHMFPIGHLPVASDRPARQLPVPAGAEDGAGLRFPPHDHPRSDVIDPGHALAWLRNGWRQPAPPPAAVLPCPPAALTEGHDPLGELSEHEWEQRYLARDGERREYVWPPGEQYPEGGSAAGEPVVLPEGALLDRFGTAHGRVYAADGTPFAQRALPPDQLDVGYRRYRVVREVPLWKVESVAWFAQPGGGERYCSVYSAAELVTLGYLTDITFEERE